MLYISMYSPAQPNHRRIRRFDALWTIMWLSLRFRK
jgi:hypothetical protein